MTNLFDVFKAIQADEEDHVSAMKACLDPNVALVSPSIERRVLTAAALIAALGVAVDANDGLGIATGGVTENTGSNGLFAATTGLSAVASQIMGGTAHETADSTYGTELLEDTMSSQKYFTGILGGLAAILGFSELSGNTSKGRLKEVQILKSYEMTDGNFTQHEPIDIS